MDLTGSFQHELEHIPFQLWGIRVSQDRSALVTMVEDRGRPAIVTQRIPYTDFALDEFEFYCVERVMMLKWEY